ncbi:vesicle transport protein SFT2C [Latimeria chalumnae]|nr:PREDICTED: vesicle transport protein SFT2C [Latimeria chalumnae]|eukprot:XP_005991254.1 PREDICTED: vesicle transport protein SFT2C [Latimeria chalumnae]
MADLNRQLQEYLSQSKNGGGKSSELDAGAASSAAEQPLLPSFKDWFGRITPFFGSQSSGPSQSPSVSWPWSPEPDPCLPGLSRSQRLLGFGICLVLSAVCFGLSALYAPMLLLRARKFALLWSLGSAFALAALAILRGPSRLLAVPSAGGALYLTALLGTLYAALGLHSTVLTALGAAAQIAAIVGYLITLVPGGSAGLRFLTGLFTSAFRRSVSKTLPV